MMFFGEINFFSIFKIYYLKTLPNRVQLGRCRGKISNINLTRKREIKESTFLSGVYYKLNYFCP
jgi:hypothetical protein